METLILRLTNDGAMYNKSSFFAQIHLFGTLSISKQFD